MATPSHRAAFITGASSGIGAAVARHLGSRGVHVCIAARREEALHALAEGIRSAGGQASVFPLDVTDPDDVRRTMEAADERVGGIDLVVANAGIAPGRWSGKLSYERCRGIIDVNVRGATATLLALTPRMVERKRGHVVGISSIAQYRGLPKFAAYSASKAYLSHFLEAMRVDLRGTGVTITDIRPGYVKTEMTGGARPPFLMDVDDAAARIGRAIESRRSVVTFPLPMAMLLRTLSVLPNPIYDRVVTRIGV